MKREIKFRGKDINGSWVYGHLGDGMWDGGITQLIADGYINEDTIGQYIGRDDKNSEEIFEGDIVRWYSVADDCYVIGKIIWSDYHLGFVIEDIDGFCCEVMRTPEIEVIGNIYDNPNLLKEDGDE